MRLYIVDIGMEFGIGNCAMLIIKRSQRHLTDGRELPNQNQIRTPGEKETYKSLGTLEADTIKQMEMKDEIQKRISQENQKATREETM